MNTNFLDAACEALRFDPLERGLQISDAANLARQHFPCLDPEQPVLIARLYNRAVAQECKRTLLVLYPRDHIVWRIDAVGTAEQKIETMPLGDLDRRAITQDGPYTSQTMLFIPPLSRHSSLNALAEIVAHLRAPEGCPWDREQTHQSLRKYLLEETYEALGAIDEGDVPHLKEELGDLLAHLLLQIQIAHQADEFSLTDVVAEISAKLVRRHPHVFGDVKVNDTAEIIENWERIKQSEKREARGEKREAGGEEQEAGGDKSEIPLAMPALMQAQKAASKHKTRVSAKAIAARAAKLPRAKDREKSLGEVLFALAAYAAAKGIDAESALREVARKNLTAKTQLKTGRSGVDPAP